MQDKMFYFARQDIISFSFWVFRNYLLQGGLLAEASGELAAPFPMSLVTYQLGHLGSDQTGARTRPVVPWDFAWVLSWRAALKQPPNVEDFSWTPAWRGPSSWMTIAF